jgi:hypothetical protein
MAEQMTQTQQMQALESSLNFMRTGEIPEIDASVSFREVYEQHLKDVHGAFFVVQGGERRHFVRARLLARHVLQRARRSLPVPPAAGDDARNEALRQVVAAICDTPIGQIVDRVWRESPVLPVQAVPTGADESTLRMLHDGVFEARTLAGDLGWFLNHETVRDATTDKTIFWCTNPHKRHKNISPDHGSCSRCPYPIGNANSASHP